MFFGGIRFFKPLRLQSLLQRWKHGSSVQMDIVQKRKALAQFKDKTEVTIFDRQAKRNQYSWGPWVVGGQMLMWLNFADFYWRYSMDKNEETGELALSPKWKRACISAVAIIAGVSIGGGILHYISRSVARMRVVNNGQTVLLDTYRISGRGTRTREYPISAMYSRDTLVTGKGPQGVTRDGSPQYSIYAPGNAYAFIMNRSGSFKSPKTFDILFHRSIVKK
ncbi:hypothetical protein LPJ66_001500 [Kickxella alabastrina]|uniref:Uncharacterized protein n=1 Tax=Kickxella alabastrina TaxID=61397 RepID=A0ACC1IT20_9FUNG|nr:hypothetical protein LPJ66_001500 [Kickxella alabastrina]